MPSASESARTSSAPPVISAALVALISLGVLVLLAIFWGYHPSTPAFDIAIQRMASDWSTSMFAPVMQGISYFGSLPATIGGAILIALFLWWRGARRTALIWLVCFAAGVGVLFGLKQVFNRARPSAPGMLVRTFGFPSGHAFHSTLVYGMLLLLGWDAFERLLARWGFAIMMVGMVLSIGWSRLVLNVHYATDVLGGYALGVFWLSVTWILLVHQGHSKLLSSATRSRR